MRLFNTFNQLERVHMTRIARNACAFLLVSILVLPLAVATAGTTGTLERPRYRPAGWER